ncbi:hypothetical protein GN956_G4338 [Arapaima gigas]
MQRAGRPHFLTPTGLEWSHSSRPHLETTRKPRIASPGRAVLRSFRQSNYSTDVSRERRIKQSLFISKTLATDMIIRLGRLTPGYFRLLQRQVAGEVQTQPQDRAVNQIAMMLAIMGLSLSYYSARQMTENVQREPNP